jgi:hypothetical protein
MYGLDDINGWVRLLGVLPKDQRALVDAAKAQVDLWINSCVLSFLFFMSNVIMIVVGCIKNPPAWGFDLLLWPAVALLLARVSYLLATNAAIEWGEVVKAAYDVFIPKLREAMQFKFAGSSAGERALWTGFSQAIIYRDPERIPERVQPEGKTQCATTEPVAETRAQESGDDEDGEG